MADSDEKYKQFQDSLDKMQGRFHVLDTNVSVEKQMEYFRYSGIITNDKKKLPVEDAIEVLNSPEASEDKKKYAIALLATSKDVKAYRILEAYAQHPEENLKDWVDLSLLQARIVLESEFSEEKQIFISTGLGGKRDLLRFFGLFKSNHLVPFSPYQIQLIEKELSFLINEAKGTVEELKVCENYFTLIFLMSIKVNVKKIIENILIECNQYGDFIDRSFIITNVKIFDENDIKEELEKSSNENSNN